MSTSGRLVICNMTVEAGATSGIVPPDEETLQYLRKEAGVRGKIKTFGPDADASYDRIIEIDVSKLAPQIACPHTVDNVKPIEEVEGKKPIPKPKEKKEDDESLDDLSPELTELATRDDAYTRAIKQTNNDAGHLLGKASFRGGQRVV